MDATALADEARTWARSAPMLGKSVTRELDRGILLARELADALETLQTDLDARFEHSDHQAAKYYQRWRDAEKHARMRASELADLARERDALAAEVERLKLVHVGQARLAMLAVYLADVDGDDGTQAFYREWVRAHDAALIESLADYLDRNFQDIPAWTEAYREGVITNEWMVAATRMTMSAIGVIRERARQVREGEA